MISNNVKQQIVEAVKAHSKNYSSLTRQGNALGVSASQLSRVLNGEFENVLSDVKWISIARAYNVAIGNQIKMETARTAVFNHIWQQLQFAQENSVSGILCDRADIGKTHTAITYARENRNVAFVDCGRHKTKSQFIRAIAREFGFDAKGTSAEIFENLIFYIKTLENPLVILDEFGDLSYPAYLEFKALWNAVDKYCGWYAMGADGLRVKIDRLINRNKVGFAEIFSRLGNKYQRITPETDNEFNQFQRRQIAQIGKANNCKDIQRLYAKSNGSLRRIPIQISLERRENGN